MADDGSADPRLARALVAHDGTAGSRAEVLAAFVGARLFVAVTATSTAEHAAEATGLRAESSAEMALMSLVSAAGTRAVPAFADTSALSRWRADVRPVAVAAGYLCRAALDDGCVAVVLDPGQSCVVLDQDDLRALAEGYVPVPGAAVAARRTWDTLTAPAVPPDPALVRMLHRALRPERLRAARLLDGPGGPVLGIAPRHPLTPADLAALGARLRDRLGPRMPPGGLDLAMVPAAGPGWDVTRRGR